MTIGVIALLVAVVNIVWVCWWSWWTYRNAVRVGYDKALHDREALVDLAANMASRYAIDPDEAHRLITAGLIGHR